MASRQQFAGVESIPGTTAYHTFVTVAAGSQDEVAVGTVTDGTAFEARAFAVSTVEDPSGDFDVSLLNGREQVTPQQTPATMATDEISLPAKSEYGAGDEIIAELDARDRAASIDVTVVVGGFLFRNGDNAENDPR